MIVLDSGDKVQGDAAAASVVDYSFYGLDNNVLKQLADGQLSDSTGDLYTADSVDVVSTVILVNTDSVARAVNLFMLPSAGTARRIIPEDMSLGAGYSLQWSGDKLTVINTSGQIVTESSLPAHKDSHDPEDGGDPLDTANAAEISVVVAAGTGTSHSLARADHVHAINHAITDNHIVTIDGTTNQPVNTDYAKFTANGLEGKDKAGMLSDLNVADGADVTSTNETSHADVLVDGDIGETVLAQQTIGIANGNLLEVDGTPLDTEVAVFTATGINGLSTSEVKSLLTYLQAGDANNMADAVLTRPEIKDYSETPVALTIVTNTLTLDLEDGNVFTWTATDNVTTFAILNWLSSKAQSLTLFFTQAASTKTIDWTDESILWAGGTAPDITTVSSKHVICISSPDGGTTKYGFHASSEAALPA